MNNWVRVTDAMPVIPEGKFGINVLVCTYDPSYDEWNAKHTTGQWHISSGYGCSVDEVSYHCVRDKDGNVPSTFNIDHGEYQFMELMEGYADDTDWVPLFDQVTHWMYLPEPPAYDTVWDEEKDRLIYVYKD